MNGFHLKPFCDVNDGTEQKKSIDVEQEAGTDGTELEDGTDGVEQEDSSGGAKQDDGTDGVEEEDGSVGAEQGDGTDGKELEDGTDSVEQEDGSDGAEQDDGTDGAKQNEEQNDELKDGQWLSCDVINCAQSLLRKEFPQQNGLQSTKALKKGKKWKSAPESFAQIVHDNSHWICTTICKCRSGEVEIFDSAMQKKYPQQYRGSL